MADDQRQDGPDLDPVDLDAVDRLRTDPEDSQHEIRTLPESRELRHLAAGKHQPPKRRGPRPEVESRPHMARPVTPARRGGTAPIELKGSLMDLDTPVSASLDALCAKLEGHRLLRWLSQGQVARVASVGTLSVFDEGAVVVREGARADSMYLILSGSMGVFTDGSGQRTLAQLESGDFFGEMSLVAPKTRSATVVAREKTEVFRLPHHALRELASEDPLAMNALLVAIIDALSQRLRRMNVMVSSVGELSEWLAGSLI